MRTLAEENLSILYFLLFASLLAEADMADVCSRETSRVVRRRWVKLMQPVYDEYHILMGPRCPLHASRDKYSSQENYKGQESSMRWRCDYCGKMFQGEAFIDLHMDNRHSDKLKEDDATTCLSDWCDVFRCEILTAPRGYRWKPESCSELSPNVTERRARCQNLIRLCVPEGVEYREVHDAMEEAVCGFLTCEKYGDRSDIDVDMTPTILYTVVTIFLIFGAIIYYVIAWTHFYDEPLLDSRHVYEEEQSTDLTRDTCTSLRAEDVRQRRHNSTT